MMTGASSAVASRPAQRVSSGVSKTGLPRRLLATPCDTLCTGYAVFTLLMTVVDSFASIS